ncbi:ankyrin repeat domain-containing protein [Bryobacter aggregatus]|uniref:ankyrin repeat domain-containing protein n=1 Tax=Bryobacter aggregatus TaxID=360054 RepID=UPI00068E52D4|nr:ankyrin repeat domain-containing protein [Bryobacter aggregatus]
MAMLEEILEGRTDLVFEYIAAGESASATDEDGTSLLQWCAYYGDVSAMKLLLQQGATLGSLGRNLDLNGAAFHGHWRLVKFLIDQGADVNLPLEDTGETPLHAALCTANRLARNRVLRVLLAHGANPNVATIPNVETGAFMRDCRTKGETPLHRAAAFGDEGAIQMLLDSTAVIDARDANGETPLSWASWYCRPIPILRKLLYGRHRISASYGDGMEANLLGNPMP